MQLRFSLAAAAVVAAVGVAGAPAQASPASAASGYSISQAISDKAQENTIAFSGLAFTTGTFGADTFLPPGKIADYFGFQYMRDIQPRGQGHNTDFLTRAANNMLAVLDDSQRSRLVALANSQVASTNSLAYRRFPLIQAFRRQLEGDIPSGRTSLSRTAVTRYVGSLFALDGKLSYQRAAAYASVLRSLTSAQKAQMAAFKFGDYSTWPSIADPIDKRSMSHDANVLVMTYASDMFSWYLGSQYADTYFCPERHGTYFGGFYLKDAPAMGQPDYTIDTTLTGNSGAGFLNALTRTQRRQVTAVVHDQRTDLKRIVADRKEISGLLRRMIAGKSVSESKVVSLSIAYGRLDGLLSYREAMAFSRIGRTLTAAQRAKLVVLRNLTNVPSGAYVFSEPIAMPTVTGSDSLFTRRHG